MNATPMNDDQLLKVFEVSGPPTGVDARLELPQRRKRTLGDAHEALLWQALDPQGTGTIPAAEFMKSLAIFGGDNAFTPDEVCPVAPGGRNNTATHQPCGNLNLKSIAVERIAVVPMA